MQKIASAILLACVPAIAYAQVFSDVPTSDPYAPAIEWAKNAGVLQGYPDGTFKPEQSVNRAEFLKIVLEAKSVDVGTSDTQQFSDVPQEAWYAPYVSYAKAQGVVEGYADGTFKPEQTVIFAEGLKMAYEALNVQTEDVGGAWYDRYLSNAQKRAILFTNDVDVGKGMSRKDVVWIVYRMNGNVDAENTAQISSLEQRLIVEKMTEHVEGKGGILDALVRFKDAHDISDSDIDKLINRLSTLIDNERQELILAEQGAYTWETAQDKADVEEEMDFVTDDLRFTMQRLINKANISYLSRRLATDDLRSEFNSSIEENDMYEFSKGVGVLQEFSDYSKQFDTKHDQLASYQAIVEYRLLSDQEFQDVEKIFVELKFIIEKMESLFS